MKLSSYISQINQTYTETSGNANSSLEQGLKNGMDVIMDKQTGQTILGEVLMRNQNDILLSLGKNQLLHAKLDGSISAEPGQLLTFLIKNNNANKVVLSPLFENTNQNPNISRAISAAGLPQTETVINMVKSMMEEGMPIDRQSLYNMNKVVNANPQADVTSLVQMQRLQLPITEESIFQFEAYKNYQHLLGDGLMDVADSIVQTFAQLSGNVDSKEAFSFYSQILNIITGDETAEPTMQTDSQTNSLTNPLSNSLANSLTESLTNSLSADILLSEPETKELAGLLKNAGFSEEFIDSFTQKPLNSREFLQQIEQFIKSESNTPDKESILDLFDSKPFKSLLKNELNKQWLLLPEEVATEHSVDKLYERLNNQMRSLNQLLSNTARENSPLARTLTQVSGNIDFMNQLNQMFTYVQIPLKMQNREATGELFVYTNKKNLAKEDGSVSALLHLDMDHLGSVDIHVKLEEKNVSTKFILQDEKALDLIAENIQMLNQRLAKRGYTMNAEFVTGEDQKNVMEEMLMQDKNITILAGHSFDAKA